MNSFVLIIFFLIVCLGIAFLYWLYKVYKLFRQKQIRKASIQLSIILALLLFGAWEFRLIPLSVTHDFYLATPDISGRKFWAWKKFRFEEWSVRGEGYSIQVYHLNDTMTTYFNNPEAAFFQDYPTVRFNTSKWQRTPLSKEDSSLLPKYMPVLGQWSKSEIKRITEYQDLIKKVVNKEGAYYAMGRDRSNEFFLISPEYQMIIYIYNNE